MPVLLGDYLTLTCSVYNSNETIFYWFLNDTILSGQSTNTYVISGVQLSDLGYYKCGNNPNYTQSERFHVYYKSSKYYNVGLNCYSSNSLFKTKFVLMQLKRFIESYNEYILNTFRLINLTCNSYFLPSIAYL